MVHDCSITERWTVVYDLPVTFDLDAAMGGARVPLRVERRPTAPASALCRSAGAGADVRWFEVEPCYVFHPLNAHDDGDRVVLDVVRHPQMFDADRLGPDDGAPHAVALDHRHRRPARSSEEQLDDRAAGVPRGRRAARRAAAPLRLRPPRSAGPTDDNGFGGRPRARSTPTTGDADRDRPRRRRVGGEWVMVPRARGRRGGRRLAAVASSTTPPTDRSELVVLAAADPAAGPVATVQLPGRVPLGFHGNWVPAA